MTTLLEYLEAEFGPATYGDPTAWADATTKANPYLSFKYAGPTEASVVEAILDTIKHRSLGGAMLLRTEPTLKEEDGRFIAKARLTFARGMMGRDDQEGKEPVEVTA